MRSLLAPGLLLILGSGCRSRADDRGEEALPRAVESLAGALKARDADLAIRDSKLAAVESELAERTALVERLSLKAETLLLEDSAKTDRMKALQLQLDSSQALSAKLEADLNVFVRQLEVQLGQIGELTNKVEEHRARLARSLAEKSILVTELEYVRETVTRLQKELAARKYK